MLIDSHCHLDFPDFADDLDAIVARARIRITPTKRTAYPRTNWSS